MPRKKLTPKNKFELGRIFDITLETIGLSPNKDSNCDEFSSVKLAHKKLNNESAQWITVDDSLKGIQIRRLVVRIHSYIENAQASEYHQLDRNV